MLIATTALPVLAHDAGRRGEHPRHDRGRRVERPTRHGAHARHIARVVAPRRIRAGEVRIYRPYFRGRVYDPGHRHTHAVYDFPVRTRDGVVYRPHAYCDGRLFLDGYVTYQGDHFGVTFGF
jgi:hypothetical protein